LVQTQEWGYQVATASLSGAVVGSLVYRQRMTVGDGRWIEAPRIARWVIGSDRTGVSSATQPATAADT
jgi:hypothetical protein